MSVSCLFKDFTVVSPDENQVVKAVDQSFVAVRDGLITYNGPSEAAAQQTLTGCAYEICLGKNRLLLPAFANAHNHLAMTLLRNQADDHALHDWLFQIIFPRETRLTYDIVYKGSLLAMAEMIRSGTAAAADMYFHQEAAAQAALEVGFRLNLAVDPKRTAADGSISLDAQYLTDQINRYQKHATDLLRVSLLVHSVYLYQPAVYPQLADLARSTGCPVHVHIAETAREVAECLERYHRRPAAQLEAFGFFETPTIAAHCVHLDDDERAVLARHPILAAHCPVSNLKLGSGIADLAAMRRAGIRLGIGTDGAASNNNLDLYKDIRMASFLAKGSTGDAAVMPAADLLSMATSQGMAGLGFARSGRIAAGMAADLQIVRTDMPSMVPLGNPVSALVYSADGSAVESLMAAGRWLMVKRELQTIDEERLLVDVRQAAAVLNQ